MMNLVVRGLRFLMLLALTGATGVSGQSPGLVALHRVGPGPPPSVEPKGIFHHSHWGLDSTFEGPPAGSHWDRYLWFRYTGCPATLRGAFRLTVYVSRSPLGVPPYRHNARYRRQYTRTIVDLRESDTATYTFPVTSRRYYPIHVVIPATAGCQSWQSDVGCDPDAVPACTPPSSSDEHQLRLREHAVMVSGP
jgi:hypothetical protein